MNRGIEFYNETAMILPCQGNTKDRNDYESCRETMNAVWTGGHSGMVLLDIPQQPKWVSDCCCEGRDRKEN